MFLLWVEPGDEFMNEEPVEYAYEDQAFDNSENLAGKMTIPVVELSRQMSSRKDLVVEPSQLGSLKGLNGTRNTRVILVRPLTVKVKAYVQLRWY